MNDASGATLHFVRGDATGLLIPAHGGALRESGEAFLTQAFHAFGALSPHNRVVEITRLERCPGGSTGEKFFLSVEYERDEGLDTELFVKFSRDFNDPIRDARGKYEMEGEVRLAAVSRLPAFPIRVPTAYFADYEHATHTGVLITQRIAFGAGGIEPHRSKCMDHELAQPLEYYRAIVASLARIAGAHKSSRLSPQVEQWFPFDPQAAADQNPIPYDVAGLQERVRTFAEFVARCPQLFPGSVNSPAFFSRLEREVGRFLEHEAAIKRFLQSNVDLIALCHWNANIDNAWFWRSSAGELQCGLMDWGNVGQMNVAYSLWGSLCAAPLELWNRHLDELLTLFVDEFRAYGGPRVSRDELQMHLTLYATMMGLSYFLDSPGRILFRLPEAVAASGPHDPIFRKSETVRNQLHISTIFLNLWQTRDPNAALDRLLQRSSSP